jgi:hypothetical protein
MNSTAGHEKRGASRVAIFIRVHGTNLGCIGRELALDLA